jgi:hypothetical protein
MLSTGLPTKTWPAWAILGIGLLGSVFVSLQVKQDTENDAVSEFTYRGASGRLRADPARRHRSFFGVGRG